MCGWCSIRVFEDRIFVNTNLLREDEDKFRIENVPARAMKCFSLHSTSPWVNTSLSTQSTHLDKLTLEIIICSIWMKQFLLSPDNTEFSTGDFRFKIVMCTFSWCSIRFSKPVFSWKCDNDLAVLHPVHPPNFQSYNIEKFDACLSKASAYKLRMRRQGDYWAKLFATVADCNESINTPHPNL